MFDALKKKLSSWFGSAKEPSKKPKKKEVKSKPEKPSSKIAERKAKKISPEIESEREVSKEVIKDIKKEQGDDIRAVPQLEASEADKIKSEGGFFSRLVKKFTGNKITQEQFDEIFMELEITLLENNVALEVVDKIRENLSRSLLGKEIKKSDIEKNIMESLKNSILEVLIEPPSLIEQINTKSPFVILFFGINGTGKTTTIAKVAHLLKQKGISCVLAAADTFRAASIEQLKVHANRIEVPIVSHDYGSDPAAVAFDAVQYAKKNHIKVVLIDTAGRMYTKANLLKEMEKIIRVSKPDLKLFVGESITGNDATEQAKTFSESAGIDGIVLSKADIDEKAGTILSVSYITKKPIYFLGTGQNYSDLEVFNKSAVLKNLGLS